jgi:CRP-like cAMP-binding protein
MASPIRSGFTILPEPHQKCATCPVRRRALFNGVSEENLDWTERFRSYQTEVPPKQNIFLEGEPSAHAYTLFRGWAAIYKTLPNGKRQIMRFALPGDFLGFQADLEGPLMYGAVAVTGCVLCTFPRSNLKQMLRENQGLAMQMAVLNARYMELCQYHLMGTGRQSAKERIAFLLLELFYRSRLQVPDAEIAETTVPFPICQEEIADAVGLTTVHVNRTLKEMKAEGLLECTSRRLVIRDEQRLVDISNFDKSIVENQLLL